MRLFIINIGIATLALTMVLARLIPRFRRKMVIKRWYQSLSLEKHRANFQQLFSDIDGFSVSRQARLGHDAIEYTYGEIDFVSFIALMSLTNPNTNTLFYDLGSGTGKAVLACAIVFNVRKCCGIELFSTLHNSALRQLHHLQRLPDYHDKATSIHFINGDFLLIDFSDATLIFLNATAFFGEMWTAINHQLKQVKPGTIIITTSKKLSLDAFIVKKTTTVQMSWGLVRAYIHQRLQGP